jgi:hypothetical protein
VYLVYIDESGNTGRNLSDPAQPIFLLCAMIVDAPKWQILEAGLKAVLDTHFSGWQRTSGFEIHATDLRRGAGLFRGVSVASRIAFRDAWMRVGKQIGVRLISRAVSKKAYARWLSGAFGGAVWINPHVAAFALLSRCVNNYLASLGSDAIGMFISDDNKEVAADIEKSIKVLRGAEGVMRLSQIVEKGFFVDSRASLPLQLCDLYAMSLRKASERKAGAEPKSFDDSGIILAESLIFRDNKHDEDVIKWLTEQHKTGAKK